MMPHDELDEPAPLLSLSSAPPPLRRALEVLASSPPPPLSRARRDQLFLEAVLRADPRGPPVLVRAVAFVAACLLGAVLVAGLFHALATAPVGPEIDAAPSAIYSLEGRTVVLSQGRLTLTPRQPLTVRARDLEISLETARVLMDVSEHGLKVHVESGEAVVHRAGLVEQRLRAGETWHSRTDPQLQLSAAVPQLDGCPAGAEACLEHLAAGNELEAENALFELALLAHRRGDWAAALSRFRGYQARFPQGVLAPEASVGVMLALSALSDDAGVAAEARRFLKVFPNDARAERVRALVH
jgi:hypothetical protein